MKSAISLMIIILQISATPGEAGIIIDTDMGLDDVRAIFAILASSEEIHAFITVEGSTRPGKGADNLIGLIEAAEYRGAVVMIGEGNPGIEPPPWRKTASSLAGVQFPPPRYIHASRKELSPLLHEEAEHGGKFEYLALGPLSNLSGVEISAPGFLSSMGRIWIPVGSISKKGRVESWNLVWDIASAGNVLKSGTEIVLVDVSGISRGAAEKVLLDVSGGSPASRWIEEAYRSAPGHVGLYDEVAAAAVLSPNLFTIRDQLYSAEIEENGIFINKDSRGSIRVAEVGDSCRLASYLHGLWLSGDFCASLDHHAHEEVNIDPLDFMRAFHGHLGPWVVIGYRAGKAAIDSLSSSGHFGISAVVGAPSAPPISCFIDGIQLGSGCTLGKRNISAPAAAGPPSAVFTSEDGGKVEIRILPEAEKMVSGLVDSYGVEEAGARVWKVKRADLFILKKLYDKEN